MAEQNQHDAQETCDINMPAVLYNLNIHTQGGEMPKNAPEPKTETLAETEDYLVWSAEEPDGETTYHVELGNVTVHFFREEWDQFLALVKSLGK